MKHVLFLGAISCIVLAGLIPESIQKRVLPYLSERPTINIPHGSRQRNWVSLQGEGSCVHASMVMLFRWQGQPEIAEMWRKSYSGGERWMELEAKLKVNKINYASTHGENDVEFLEWAIRTRRGCIVTISDGAHMVCLVELNDQMAGILDNNSPEKIIYMPRDQFLSVWFSSYSWACTPMFTPPPPILR